MLKIKVNMNKQHLYSGAIGAIIIVITLIIICIACSWCDYALIYISDPSAKETNLGIVLTPAEYMNHIGGFYNTIIEKGAPGSSPSFWISVRMNIYIEQQKKRLKYNS